MRTGFISDPHTMPLIEKRMKVHSVSRAAATAKAPG
jgi:hypothetical protein